MVFLVIIPIYWALANRYTKFVFSIFFIGMRYVKF